MKYKFIIMTNFTTELEIEIKKFNIEKNTDLKFLRILDDEVTFVELETSISNELLFEFGVQFGKVEARTNIEVRT